MIFNIQEKLLIIGLISAIRCQAADLMKVADALKLAYPEAGATFVAKALSFSAQERKLVETELGSKIYSSGCLAYSVSAHGKALGIAMVDDELGKHLPMTFLVALDADTKIKRVELLSYRERYGQGVQSRKFMAQFEEKNSRDALIIGRGIDAVTGATISSKAISLGVRKAFKLAEKFKETP